MEHTKWVQVKFAAFAGDLGSRPERGEAIEEHGLCLC